METEPVKDEIPAWALTYLRTQLPPGAELLNAVTLDKGRFSGSVLANTTKGAILLTKSSVGEPKAQFLPVPGSVINVTCESCGHVTELHNPPLPAEVHCSRCGARYRIASEQEIQRLDGGEPTPARKRELPRIPRENPKP